MATFGTNTDQFSRVLNSTIADYVKKQMENILAKYVFLAMLKEKGKIKKSPGGDSKQWAVRYKRNTLHYLTDLPSISFQRINKRVNAKLTPRGYWMSDQVSMMERWVNRGPAAIIDVTNTIMSELMDDFKFALNEQPYKDGNATATNKGWSGTETFGAMSGSVSGNAAVGSPSDTYAGLATNLGVKGSWDTTNWPNGTGSVGYHYWSPLIALYDSTLWDGTNSTWRANCLRCLAKTSMWQDLRGQKVDLWLLTGPAYDQCYEKVEGKEQIRTERSASNSLMIKLGFGKTFNYQGTEVTYERGLPVTDVDSAQLAGYGFNWDGVELTHWTPDLVWSPEVDFSIESLSQRYMVGTVSELCFNPQAVVKIRKTTSTDSALN